MKLMKVTKNPIENHLLVDCRKIVMSFRSKKVESCRELMSKVNQPIALVVGAFTHRNFDVPYKKDVILISNNLLSTALVCSKLCSTFEEVWGIV